MIPNSAINQNEDGTFCIVARKMINRKSYKKEVKRYTGTKRQAERVYIDLLRDIEDQAEADQQERNGSLNNFSQCVDFYMKQKEPRKGDKTYCDRLKMELGSCDLKEIPEAFERFMNLLSRSKTNRGKPYSSATKNRYRSWITAILNFAVENGKIEESPFKFKMRKEKEFPRDRYLSSEEIERLFSAIEEYRPYLKPLVQFLLQIPCRKAEVLNARRVDLDLRNSVLRIRSGTTKNGRGIDKPIPPNMDEYFRSIPLACPWVFYRKVNGEYFQLKSIDTAWRFCLEKAGIEDLRIHDTRHIAVTELHNQGLPTEQMKAVTGWMTDMNGTYYHRSGSTTTKTVRAMLSAKKDSGISMNGTD